MYGVEGFGNVRVRGPQVDVLVRVWGWDDARMARHDDLLERIIDYVAAAFHCGLLPDEIKDDLIDIHGDLFEDADVEIDENDEVRGMLVPPEG